ncbi:MAG: enoyl-[acyl-carrier-protein] reductase FabK [Synergistales bacterium]|nr:enoyl-[acyl-carrier-protein] reductase FabK [Synergistales bacterium]
MALRTRITDLLGTEYPIVQGGMAWVANASLAAAVSNGGGLGIIAAANMPIDLLEEEIKRARAMTSRPFGVNIMLLSPTADEALELVASYRVPIVTTGAGSPGKVIERLKPLGTVVIPVIASVAHAKRVAKQGADAVVAEGSEAGGHVGETSTMCLVPQIVDTVDMPVIAAGGIADGRGIAAAFALGAEGVQVGTRFVCAGECTAHDNYKKAIIKARDRSTVLTGRPTGHPVRCIKNKLTQQFEELERGEYTLDKLEELGAGRLRQAVVDGDSQYGSVMSGEIAGLVKTIQPAAEIIRGMFDEADQVFGRLGTRCERKPE